MGTGSSAMMKLVGFWTRSRTGKPFKGVRREKHDKDA